MTAHILYPKPGSGYESYDLPAEYHTRLIEFYKEPKAWSAIEAFVNSLLQEGYIDAVLAEALREGYVVDERDIKPNYRVNDQQWRSSAPGWIHLIDQHDKECVLAWSLNALETM